MRRFALLAAAAAAAVASTVVATPAAATAVAARPAERTAAFQRTALDGSTVCLHRTNTAACADYQAQLLRTVEKAAAKRTAISVNDLGSRQLDALIASVN